MDQDSDDNTQTATPATPLTAAHAHTDPAAHARRGSRAGSIALRVGVGVVVIGGVLFWLRSRGHHDDGGTNPGAGSSTGSGQGSGSAERAVPVQVVTAEKKDVPIWLEGLGSVAAVQQVTVHTQVDGRLDKVAFVEGQPVKKGEVIAQIDPRPYQVQLHSAEGSLLRDQAQLDANKAQLARYKELQAQQLVAAQQVETFAASVGQFQGNVEIDRAQIEQARLQLDYAQIKSPLDGVTGVRLVDAGNIVHAADATGLVVITQINPAAVYFTVPEDKLVGVEAAIHAGEVRVEVRSRDGVKLLGTGTLSVLDNQVNQTTATLRLKAIVPNDGNVMWPNAFVKARMLVETRKGAVVVPAVAIQQGPTGGSFVYIVADGAAKMTPVTVALITGDQAVIEKGLDGGEQVVIEGANQVRNGGKVEIVKPGQQGGPAGNGSGGPGGSPHAGAGNPSGGIGSGAGDHQKSGGSGEHKGKPQSP